MISFRLTAEEYDRIRELCFTHGIRSVSEMARSAVNRLLQQPVSAPQESFEVRLTAIESRIRLLALELKNLNRSALPGKEAKPLTPLSSTSQ